MTRSILVSCKQLVTGQHELKRMQEAVNSATGTQVSEEDTDFYTIPRLHTSTLHTLKHMHTLITICAVPPQRLAINHI